MRTILSVELKLDGSWTKFLPRGALYLSTQVVKGSPIMWFEVDTTKSHEERSFRLFPSGRTIPPTCKVYLGTIQLNNGDVILHIYEEDLDMPIAAINAPSNVFPLHTQGVA